MASLKNMFASKEAEVVETVKGIGLDSAMVMYGVKHRGCFLKWLRDNTGEEWKFDSSSLAGLSGGDKAKWDREHRDTILDCLEIFGVDWVKANFRFSHDTLEGLIGSDHHPFTGYDKKLTRLERVELDSREALKKIKQLEHELIRHESRLDITQEDSRMVKCAQRYLEESYSQFIEATAKRIAQALIIPLLHQFAGSGDGSLPLKPLGDLDIDNLIAQGTKYIEQQSTDGKAKGILPLA